MLSEPIWIPSDLTPEEVEKWRRILEDRLNELTLEADRRIGFKGQFSLDVEGQK